MHADPIIAASHLAEWLTAAGTIGAVIAAVGLQAWISWKAARRRPQLELALDQHYYTSEANHRGDAVPFLRVAVSNLPGKEAAHDVEVLVESVVDVAGSGVRRWLVNPALGWPNSLDPLPRMTIPPGVTRYVDIGWWVPRGSEMMIRDRSAVTMPRRLGRRQSVC